MVRMKECRSRLDYRWGRKGCVKEQVRAISERGRLGGAGRIHLTAACVVMIVRRSVAGSKDRKG